MNNRKPGVGLLVLVLATLLAGTTAAFAADSAQDKAEARRLYSEAKRLRKQGKLAEALDLLQRAQALAPTPVTNLELARALEGEHKLIEAEALAAAVETMPVSPTETQKGKEARAEAKAFAQSLGPRIPRATFNLSADSAETKVALNGTQLSKSLLGSEIPLNPGEHHVSVSLSEKTVFETRFALVEGEKRALVLEVPPPETPKDPAPEASSSMSAPPPILVPTALPTSKLPPPKPPEHKTTVLVPVAFSIGGVALGLGIVTGAIAMSQVGTLVSGCPNGLCPPEQHDLLATHQALTTISTISFPVAAAAAVGGTVAWILDTRSAQSGVSAKVRWLGTGIAIEGAW